MGSQLHHRRPNLLNAAQVGIFLLFFLLALAYSVVIPVGEGVDEIPHVEYVRFVGENWRIPIQPWQDNGQPLRVWMAHHPPLYYFLLAGVSAWADLADLPEVMRPNPHFVWTETDPSNGWNVYLHTAAEQFPYQGSILALHYLRVWSVLMGMVTIWAVIRTGALLLPSQPWVVLTAAALTAFHPAFLFMSSTIHHDPLMAMIFALSLWWMVRAIYRPPGPWSLLAAGLLLGAGLITKLAGLSLAPLFGLTLLLINWQARAWRPLVRQGVIVFGVAALVAGWWYARNQIFYDDPLAWEMFLTVFAHMERQTPYSWELFRHEFLAQLSRTFWGAFGYMHITLPAEIRRLFWWGSAVVLLGAVWAGWRRGRQLTRESRLGWLILLTAVLLVFLSFFRLSINMLGAGQGRYLMTIITPISLLLALGLHQWTGFRWPRLTMLVTGLAFFAFSTWVLLAYVRPLYPLPTTATLAQAAAAQPIEARFADGLALVGYEVDAAGIPPGESGQITLFWQPLGETRPDFYLKLRVVDAAGNVVYATETWPLPSSSTTIWGNDQIYVTYHPLDIAPTAAVGPGVVEIALQPGRQGEPITAVFPSDPVWPQLFLGQRSSLAADGVDRAVSAEFRLGEDIRLTAHEMQLEGAESAELVVTLYWAADAPLAENYTVFVHVLDENGRLIAQQDNQPNNGLYPTTAWQTGVVVQDRYFIPLPAGNSESTVQVGMYLWPSLERLPVTQDGVFVGETAVLGTIRAGK